MTDTDLGDSIVFLTYLTDEDMHITTTTGEDIASVANAALQILVGVASTLLGILFGIQDIVSSINDKQLARDLAAAAKAHQGFCVQKQLFSEDNSATVKWGAVPVSTIKDFASGKKKPPVFKF